jgi:hypothetical protein
MAKLFEVQKPRQFNIEPRYWDPAKEEREAREKRIRAEMGLSDENGNYVPYIAKGTFRQGLTRNKWGVKGSGKKSNTRLLVIVALLAMLFYFLLK